MARGIGIALRGAGKALGKQLKKAPALNGKFDKLCDQFGEMHSAQKEMRDILLDTDGSGRGVVPRLFGLETKVSEYIAKRDEFLKEDVYPTMEAFTKVQTQMELQVNPIISDHDKLRQEVAELKLKQAIQAKIGWALGLTTGSMLLKAIMEMVLTSSGS